MRRSGMLGVFGLLLIPALIAIAPSVALASCDTDFPTDAGCRFAEKWGSYTTGTRPPAPWYWNGSSSGGAAAITTPGIAGDAKKMTFTMHPPNGSGYDCPGCPGGDSSGSPGFIPNGSKWWAEFFLTFSSDFRWGCAGGVSGTTGGNCSMKVWSALSADNRILFTTPGTDSDGNSTGSPYWSMYPNYAPGGTDSDGGNRATEKFGNVALSTADHNASLMRPGHFYRCILEVLVGQGTTGAYKFWVCPDGGTCIKTHDFTGLQTTSQVGWNGSGIGVGGPAAGPAEGSTWSLGSIRYTTTNISPETSTAAPTAATPPAAPTSLVVQ